MHLRELALGKGVELSRDGRDLLRLSFGAGAALDIAGIEDFGRGLECLAHGVVSLLQYFNFGRTSVLLFWGT
ncbi:hypothetical protein ES703_108268 [subsurface metagenome]